MLNKVFVENKWLHPKYAQWYEEMYKLAHDVLHGKVTEVKGNEINEWYDRADEFLREMAKIIRKIVDQEK